MHSLDSAEAGHARAPEHELARRARPRGRALALAAAAAVTLALLWPWPPDEPLATCRHAFGDRGWRPFAGTLPRGDSWREDRTALYEDAERCEVCRVKRASSALAYLWALAGVRVTLRSQRRLGAVRARPRGGDAAARCAASRGAGLAPALLGASVRRLALRQELVDGDAVRDDAAIEALRARVARDARLYCYDLDLVTPAQRAAGVQVGRLVGHANVKQPREGGPALVVDVDSCVTAPLLALASVVVLLVGEDRPQQLRTLRLAARGRDAPAMVAALAAVAIAAVLLARQAAAACGCRARRRRERRE